MRMRHFQVVLERDDEAGVWVTYVPALNYLSDFGDTREEALASTREAIAGYLEAAAIAGIPVPADDSSEVVQLDIAV